MPSLAELSGKSQFSTALSDGLDALDNAQKVTFTRYKRVVLPLDGFVFWVKASLVAGEVAPFTEDAEGAVHYATETEQNEDVSPARSKVMFTAKKYIQSLIEIAPETLWIASFDGIRFAFSRRDSYFYQSELHHYVGDAVYSYMESQIIDDLTGFDQTSLVVSNSLPIWLGLNQYMTLYPSFAVPSNLEGKFAAIHIDPNLTNPLQAAPLVYPNGSRYQLVQDTVKITTYGMRSDEVSDFVNYVQNYVLMHETVMGISNIPVIRDEKSTQTELLTLAQKKTVTFVCNYDQFRLLDISRQLITQVFPTFFVAG